MAQQTIGIGSVANDGTGDPLRTAFTKINANDTELYKMAHPGYVAGNWYLPQGQEGVLSGGSNPGAGSIRLFPFFLKQKITINALGLRVGTLSAAGNVQIAIYAHNAATGRPTGSALVSTASITTGSAGSVNAAVSVQLDVGFYWMATNCDNATAIFPSVSVGNVSTGALIGSTAQVSVIGGAQSIAGLSVSQTFGTWPDLTSGSFSDITTSNVPLVMFKVASVP